MIYIFILLRFILSEVNQCPDGQGIDPTNGECIECPFGQGINQNDGNCTPCNIGEGKDSQTKACKKCENDDSILYNGYCGKCPEGQTPDETTNICKCPSGYGYSTISQECIECSGDKYIEDGTNLCICSDKKGLSYDNNCVDCSNSNYASFLHGIDYETKKCKVCDIRNNEGIDPETRYCRQCKKNEGIDADSHEIVVCPDNTKPDPYSHFCLCDNGLGIDPNTNQCKICNEQLNYAIDIFTGKCRLCNGIDEIIDPKTKRCMCTNKKGFDEVTHQCTNCVTKYSNIGGVDNNTGICYECRYNEGIDKDTLTCIDCNEGEGINALTGHCEVCPEGSIMGYNNICICENNKGFNEENQCTECQVGEGINTKTYRCNDCGAYYGIDPESRQCTYCNSERNCISIFTKECIELTDGIIANKKHYCQCQENFGFDPITQKCIDCREQNMAIDLLNGTCVNCPDFLVTDEITNICRCPNKMGFDTQYKRCSECPSGQGINQENGFCEGSYYTGQCIDLITGFFIWPDTETQYVGNDKNCYCKDSYGLNYTTRKCEKCDEGQFADPITNKCSVCSGDNFGVHGGFCIDCSTINGIVDPKTKKCICKDNMFFYDNKCITCSSNGKWWGISENGDECVYCPNIEGHCVDDLTGICREMQDDEVIDHEIERCQKCIGGQIKDPNSEKCICEGDLGFDTIKKVCTDCTLIPGFAVDSISNKCIRCIGPYWMINMTTKKCVCAQGKGIVQNNHYFPNSYYCNFCPEENMELNTETGMCVDCDSSKHQVIDVESGLCKPCKENEGINELTHRCEVCDKGMVPDQSNNYHCACPYGQGITKENKCGICDFGEGIDNNKCVKCDVNYGINPITRQCEYCYKNTNKCINKTSREIMTIPKGMYDDENSICTCLNNFGYDSSTGTCVNCKESNQGVNWNSDECMKCGDDQIIDEYNRCNCPIEKAFNSEYTHCVNCKVKEGIDPITRICRSSISDNECISRKTGMWTHTLWSYQDEKTSLCTCLEPYYYNDIEDQCDYCEYGTFYNPIKNKCMTCPPGLALNYQTGECSPCPDDQIIDETAHLCYCKDNKGFDSNHNCIECPTGFGLDILTMKCVKVDENSCIDPNTNICIPMQHSLFIFAGYKDPISGICKCKGGLGFDINSNPFCRSCNLDEALNIFTGKCEKCLDGQFIDPKTGKCTNCKDGEGFNKDTQKCEKCKPGQGVNPIKGNCISCKENEGINKITGKCEKCPSGQAIDPLTRLCGICEAGSGVDPSQPFCKKCNDENCIICSSNYNKCISCADGFTAKDGICVEDEIKIDAITKEPTKTETIEITETDNEIRPNKPNDASSDKNYVMTIPSTGNGKKVIIKDLNNANVEVQIDKDISQVTIQQNEDIPLDIVVNYQNINNNDNNINPIIYIDTDSSKADTSLKGEGQLTLENIHGNLQLNQVVPTKDKQIIIQSSSKLNIKQIDFYGNSKVEFKNKQEKAVVNLITLQQKAITDLDNIAIEGTLKTGLFSLVSLNENVEISKADIEISFSNDAKNPNPPIVGFLKSPPHQITIQDRAIGSFLNDENSDLPIAEANNEAFKCNEWAKSFVPSSNDAFYNKAKCTGDNSNRLVAYHDDSDKGNGLSAGAIAGIVIACVVVVAIVIILVYFFVIRKKKNDSQDEDSALSV